MIRIMVENGCECKCNQRQNKKIQEKGEDIQELHPAMVSTSGRAITLRVVTVRFMACWCSLQHQLEL